MRKTSRPRQRRTATEIDQILTALEMSNLSQREFCARRGIPLSTLHAWRGRHAARSTSPPAALIPVGVVAGSDPAIELDLPGGVVIRVHAGVRAADLQIVLEALRSC